MSFVVKLDFWQMLQNAENNLCDNKIEIYCKVKFFFSKFEGGKTQFKPGKLGFRHFQLVQNKKD